MGRLYISLDLVYFYGKLVGKHGNVGENPAKSETFSGLHVKSHDQLKGAKEIRLT